MMNNILNKVKLLTVCTLLLSATQMNAAGFIGENYFAVSGEYTHYDNSFFDYSAGLDLNYNYAFKGINTDLIAGAFLGKTHVNFGLGDADSKAVLVGLRSYYIIKEKTKLFAEVDFSRQRFELMDLSMYDNYVRLSVGGEYMISEKFCLTPYIAGSKNTDRGDWYMTYGIWGNYDFSERFGAVARVSITEDSDVGFQLGCMIKL